MEDDLCMPTGDDGVERAAGKALTVGLRRPRKLESDATTGKLLVFADLQSATGLLLIGVLPQSGVQSSAALFRRQDSENVGRCKRLQRGEFRSREQSHDYDERFKKMHVTIQQVGRASACTDNQPFLAASVSSPSDRSEQSKKQSGTLVMLVLHKLVAHPFSAISHREILDKENDKSSTTQACTEVIISSNFLDKIRTHCTKNAAVLMAKGAVLQERKPEAATGPKKAFATLPSQHHVEKFSTDGARKRIRKLGQNLLNFNIRQQLQNTVTFPAF